MDPLTAFAVVAIIVVVLLAILGRLPRVHPADSSGIISAIVWVLGLILIVYLTKRFVL